MYQLIKALQAMSSLRAIAVAPNLCAKRQACAVRLSALLYGVLINWRDENEINQERSCKWENRANN